MPKEHIKKKLQLTNPSDLLQGWYDPLALHLDRAKQILHVRFPHAYFESWFQQQGKEAFERAFSDWSQEYMPKAQLHYCPFTPPKTEQAQPFLQWVKWAKGAKGQTHTNEDFASYITNSKNAFPLAAAREVANPYSKHKYNPFVLCGRNGTGKTHILRAIVTERKHIQAQDSSETGQGIGPVFFGCVDDLEKLFAGLIPPPHIEAGGGYSPKALAKSSGGGIAGLLAEYSCFVVDDIQRLAHRSVLQEELVKFMDACPGTCPKSATDKHQTQPAQLVFACTGTLATLEGLSEALRSRLEVGLVVELKAPDLDVRMRYAQKRCAESGIKAERNHMMLLAQRCTQLRQLSGIILKIQAFHDLVQRDITLSDLENILRNTGDERQTQPGDIVATVSQHTGHSVEDILGSQRKPDLVLARQTAMYLCRELLGTSYPVLGRFFGGKDHSTAMHSIKKIKKMIVSNKDAQNMVTELKQKCQGR